MDRFKELAWAQIKALKPSFLAKKPHFNFISVHCKSTAGLRLDQGADTAARLLGHRSQHPGLGVALCHGTR